METKTCNKCGQTKPVTMFTFRDKKVGKYRSYCKACHNESVKNRYHKNKDTLNKLKEGKSCCKCGYNRCVEALDYHHLEPSGKKRDVSKLSTHASLKDAIAEINKCVLLCSNCHREFHYLEKINGITIQEFLNN